WLTIKLRYKKPDGDISKLIAQTVDSSYLPVENASANFHLAAAVAEYGMLLRNSAFKEKSTWQQVTCLARNASETDPDGYRHEFISLTETAAALSLSKR
ncbi:MAG TPA: YfbK domain-containing protein, partial [Puia sp.]|nr:YfbK domain-containing protein [Puia sp.]